MNFPVRKIQFFVTFIIEISLLSCYLYTKIRDPFSRGVTLQVQYIYTVHCSVCEFLCLQVVLIQSLESIRKKRSLLNRHDDIILRYLTEAIENTSAV